MAATMDPPEVPEMTRGSSPCSCSSLTTPRWYSATAPPPDRHRAVQPWACSAARTHARLAASPKRTDVTTSGACARPAAEGGSAVSELAGALPALTVEGRRDALSRPAAGGGSDG
eukprot:scaffold25677_cov79-Isochrysis_galbana.AAC.1